MALLMLNTGNFDLIIEMKSSPPSMNIQAKPLLGTRVGKGGTAPTRKSQAVAHWNKRKELVLLVTCRNGQGFRNVNWKRLCPVIRMN